MATLDEMTDKLAKLFRDGVLVDVDVSCWTGARMLTPEDLGLEAKDVAEAYHLGRKMLIPDRIIAAFHKIEGQARNLVQTNSFPYGSNRFVPKRKLPEIQKQLKELQAKYNALVDDLVLNYDKYREEMRPIYLEAAETAYTNQIPSSETFGPDRDFEAEKKAFIDAFMARIATFYPPVGTIAGKFSLEWTVWGATMPSLEGGDGEDLVLNEEERRELAEDCNRQTHAKLESFVDSVVGELRAETVEVCGHVADSIMSGKVINSRTIQSLRNFIDRFKGLNFIGDSNIENELDKLRAEFLDGADQETLTSDEDMKTQLKTRLAEIKAVAENISDLSSVTGQYHRKISWTPKEN